MTRPCFLVIDREFPSSISTRKLVIETAKFNVLTAYSGNEAIDTFRRFPAVDGVVLDSGLEDIDCNTLIGELKTIRPEIPTIVISVPGYSDSPNADFVVESFNPADLLETLRTIQPKASAEIEQRNEDLSREHLA